MKWIISIILQAILAGTCLAQADKGGIGTAKQPSVSSDRLIAVAALLAESQVITIGEDSIPTAESIRLKVELIKYLHGQMGYNLLLMPGSLYDAQMARIGLNEGMKVSQAFAKAWPPELVYNKDMQPLMEYLKAEAGQPGGLEFSGYDILQAGNIPQTQRHDDLVNAMAKVNGILGGDHFPILNRLTLDPSAMMGRADSETKFGFIREMAEARGRFVERNPRREEHWFWIRHLNDIEDMYLMLWTLHDQENMAEALAFRQGQMAEKVKEMRQHLYPNAKVIIWAGKAEMQGAFGDSLASWYAGNYAQVFISNGKKTGKSDGCLQVSKMKPKGDMDDHSIQLLLQAGPDDRDFR